MALAFATPRMAVFRIPAVSYTIQVVVRQPCWIRLASLDSASPVFEATLLPASSPSKFTVHGPTSLMVAARAEAIRISSGGRLVGHIPQPVVGFTYEFRPVAS